MHFCSGFLSSTALLVTQRSQLRRQKEQANAMLVCQSVPHTNPSFMPSDFFASSTLYLLSTLSEHHRPHLRPGRSPSA